jgi:hypothetical protein
MFVCMQIVYAKYCLTCSVGGQDASRSPYMFRMIIVDFLIDFPIVVRVFRRPILMLLQHIT